MHADLFHEGVASELERYAEAAVAIGEIGLDYMLRKFPGSGKSWLSALSCSWRSRWMFRS